MDASGSAPEFVRYEIEDAVAVITLDRSDRANAQSAQVLRELDAAWTRADEDPEVRVIVQRAHGKHFSSGHDMSEDPSEGARQGFPVPPDEEVDEYYDWEVRHYLHYVQHWRDIPKPSIASVQGACVGGGLMLCWPCDLIVAADNAWFSDPVVRMGIPGVEFHGHTWELGARKAKELLFTGGRLSAQEAERMGMVNRVVPLAELDASTLELARTIAAMDPFALRMAKRAVNQTLDAMGFHAAVQACFDMHHLAHARAVTVNEDHSNVLADLEGMRAQNR